MRLRCWMHINTTYPSSTGELKARLWITPTLHNGNLITVNITLRLYHLLIFERHERDETFFPSDFRNVLNLTEGKLAMLQGVYTRFSIFSSSFQLFVPAKLFRYEIRRNFWGESTLTRSHTIQERKETIKKQLFTNKRNRKPFHTASFSGGWFEGEKETFRLSSILWCSCTFYTCFLL